MASTPFSLRILGSFVKDKATQWTLCVILGTFSYCMAAPPAASFAPAPFAPMLTVPISMTPTLVCIDWLILLINHISRSISVNHIVDRIARETEFVIDEPMPRGRSADERPLSGSPLREGSDLIIASRSLRYIRLADVEFLVDCAKSVGVQIVVERRVDHSSRPGRH